MWQLDPKPKIRQYSAPLHVLNQSRLQPTFSCLGTMVQAWNLSDTHWMRRRKRSYRTCSILPCPRDMLLVLDRPEDGLLHCATGGSYPILLPSWSMVSGGCMLRRGFLLILATAFQHAQLEPFRFGACQTLPRRDGFVGQMMMFDHLGSLRRSIQGSMLQREPLPGRSVARHWGDKPGQISPAILVLWLQVVGWRECS